MIFKEKKQWILTDFDPATLGLEQEKLGEGCLGKKGIRTSNKPKICQNGILMTGQGDGRPWRTKNAE